MKKAWCLSFLILTSNLYSNHNLGFPKNIEHRSPKPPRKSCHNTIATCCGVTAAFTILGAKIVAAYFFMKQYEQKD